MVIHYQISQSPSSPVLGYLEIVDLRLHCSNFTTPCSDTWHPQTPQGYVGMSHPAWSFLAHGNCVRQIDSDTKNPALMATRQYPSPRLPDKVHPQTRRSCELDASSIEVTGSNLFAAFACTIFLKSCVMKFTSILSTSNMRFL
jgi:hypothetical protein